VPLPLAKKVVRCRLVYVVKVGLDGHVDWLKVRLVGNSTLGFMALIIVTFSLSWPR